MPKDYDDVEIICEGIHNGEPFSARDIAEIVANYNKFSVIKNSDGKALLEPPVWLGHEELPDLAKRTDGPQFGDVDKLRLAVKEDGRLSARGRLHQVHNDLATWIDERKVRKISAEVYRNWKDEKGVAHGKVLRRVGLMGGTPPAVKSLNSLPSMPQAHLTALADAGDVVSLESVLTFSDRGPNMAKKDDLKSAAAKKGFPLSDSALSLMSDEAVDVLLVDVGRLPDKSAAPLPQPGFVALSDVQSIVSQQLADDRAKRKAEDDAVNAQRQRALNDAKAERAKVALDWATDDGKGNCRLRPADRQRTHDRLMRADAVNAVVKMGDGADAKTVTEFDAQLDDIRRLPVVTKFSDEMPIMKDGKIVSDLDLAAESAADYAKRRNAVGRPRQTV